MPTRKSPHAWRLGTPEAKRVLRLAAVLAVSVFVAELWLPWSYAAGVLYTLPVLLGLWIAKGRTLLWIAFGCSVLTLIGMAFPGEGDRWVQGLANRAFVLFCIWTTANLGVLRKRVERELFESREITATTLRSIADAVLTTGPDGRVTFVNGPAAELLGVDESDALGRPLEDVFRIRSDEGSKTRFVGVRGAAPRDALPVMREAVVLSHDGRELTVEGSSAPVVAGGSDDADDVGRVFVFRDVRERKQQEEQIQQLAFRDSLTGLPNRRTLLDRLGLELAHARRRRERTAVLFLDLDDFKGVNDSLGHGAGDVLLQATAARLRADLREDDTVARLGGDEFVVVLPRVARAEHALVVASKLIESIGMPVEVPGGSASVRPSIGVALYDGDSPDVATPPADADGVMRVGAPARTDGERLVERADAAMYRAKAAGGGRAVLWSPDPLDARSAAS